VSMVEEKDSNRVGSGGAEGDSVLSRAKKFSSRYFFQSLPSSVSFHMISRAHTLRILTEIE